MIIGAHIVAPGKSGLAYGSADSICSRVADVVKSVRRECEMLDRTNGSIPNPAMPVKPNSPDASGTPDAPSAMGATIAIVLAPACLVIFDRHGTKPNKGQHAQVNPL